MTKRFLVVEITAPDEGAAENAVNELVEMVTDFTNSADLGTRAEVYERQVAAAPGDEPEQAIWC